ncbi:MAG: TonB-dependent receptor plug domain-containing protein, partial [Acidobacteriota bacterium]
MIFLRHLAAAQSPETGPGPEPAKTSIVVTATRSTMETEKSPVSIGVVTRQELRVRGQQLLDQSLDLIEGVYANRGKGFQDTQSGVGMRGVSGRGSAQARTLILLDGQPLNDGYTG